MKERKIMYNDKVFFDLTEIENTLKEKVSSTAVTKIEVVTQLPEQEEDNTLYIVVEE